LPPEGLTTKLGGQLLFASRFAVDTFLILSGYLVVHVLLSKFPVTESSPSPSRFHFVSKYFQTIPGLLLHRILRIMPLYAMCLGFWTQVAPHLGGGPFWYQWEPLLESCRRFGWTNLLFVNNFFPWNLANTETCFYHSWYLAVDVQLFVLAPLLVSWYRQNKRTGQLATGLLLLLSVVMTMYLSFARKWSLNTFDGAAVARFDVEGYAKPHVRAQSYLSGMLLAMWLDASSNDRLWARTPSWKHRTAMGFALASLAFVTFCTVTGAYSRRACRYEEWPFLDECGSTWSPLATFLYAAISRAVWALAIVVIMTLCLNQQGGSVGDFLSWKGWTPLSNLSFGVYLVHPIVIFVWQLGGTQKETFRLLVFGMNYISVCVVSFAASLLLSLLVELPCATLVSQYGRRFFSSLWNPRLASRAKDEDLIQLLAANRSIEIGERPSYHYGSVGATSHSDTTHR
jgi:peptidoglycan/LPS O-acetylase OafA/YrhL